MSQFRIAALALSLLVLANSAQAQELRPGFYSTLGLGTGTISFHADASGVQDLSGPTAFWRLGTSVNPHWRVGTEVNVWRTSESGVVFSYHTIAITTMYYPLAGENLFLKGGVQMGGYKEDYDFFALTASGGGFQFGAGYDVRFGHLRGITASATYMVGPRWDIQYEGSGTGTGLGAYADPSFLQLGLGFTWH